MPGIDIVIEELDHCTCSKCGKWKKPTMLIDKGNLVLCQSCCVIFQLEYNHVQRNLLAIREDE